MGIGYGMVLVKATVNGYHTWFFSLIVRFFFGFTKMESKFNLVLDMIIHDLYERRSGGEAFSGSVKILSIHVLFCSL